MRSAWSDARQQAMEMADSEDGWSAGEDNLEDEQEEIEVDHFLAELNPEGSEEDSEHGSAEHHHGGSAPLDDFQELDDEADPDETWEDLPAPPRTGDKRLPPSQAVDVDEDDKSEDSNVVVDEGEDIDESGHQADDEAIDSEGDAEDACVDDAPDNHGHEGDDSLTNVQHSADQMGEGADYVSQRLLMDGDDNVTEDDARVQGDLSHDHDVDRDVGAAPPLKSKRGRTLKPRNPADRLPSAFLSDATRTALASKVKFTQRDEEQAMENMVQLERTAKRLTDACEADESFASAHTTPDGKATANFPDMIVTHIHTVTKPEPAPDAEKQAWRLRQGRKARHNCVVIIEEIKPPPSRRARGDHFETVLKDRLERAQQQVFNYARSYFERDRFAQTVITMAAAGPYWQWIKTTREQCYPPPPKAGKKARTFAKLTASFIARFAAAPIFALGTQESDAELTNMRDTTLIPTLENHLWYRIQLQHRETNDGEVQT